MYLDDVVMMADTFEQHLERVETVMNRLQRAGLMLNPAKCKSFQLKTKFLRHVVSGRGIEPGPEKVRAVVDRPTPRNLTEARGFVALASYYRRFISFFADIARSIHLLTRKNQPFVWKDEQRESFERLNTVCSPLRSCRFLVPLVVTCLTVTPATKRWVWFFNRNSTAC